MVQVLLKAGDILLYRSKGFFGGLIALKTWHHVSHVEVYDGNQASWASRDGQGFNHYPLRISELLYVLRPTVRLDVAQGRSWARSMIGTPYGWADLLNFVGFNVNGKGIVCSPAATMFLRACGWSVFPEDAAERIAPFQFLDLVGNGCVKAYDFSNGVPQIAKD